MNLLDLFRVRKSPHPHHASRIYSGRFAEVVYIGKKGVVKR